MSSALALGLTTFSSPADASGRVLRQAASGAASELRLAYATTDQSNRIWVQYRLKGSGRVGIVTPVLAGTFVDSTPDAWFEALEAATAPRVVPPPGIAEACGSATKLHMTGTLAHEDTLPPSAVAVLTSVEAAKEFAQTHSLPFYFSDEQALLQYGPPYVGLVYDLAGGNVLTEAVRYTTLGAEPPIALSLAAATSAAPDVTLWTIGEGRAAIGGIIEHTPDTLGFSWLASQATSDYPARRRELLEKFAGLVWLVETAGNAPLMLYATLPEGAGQVPSVVHDYLKRSSSDPDTCLQAVLDAHELGKSGATISKACPKGSLAIVPDATGSVPACSPDPSAGEIASANLHCESAEDLAHAFSGMSVSEAEITRHRNVLAAAASDPSIGVYDGSPLPRVFTAPQVDLQKCKGPSGSGGATSGSGGSGAYSGSSGYSGSGSGGGYWEEEPDHVHTDVDVSCSGSGSGDSCSGDSSSSSDDSCSGDSSSGSDDSCSGDSSSGSDDACSGDSSSGSDGACSGDSGGGSDGCSGDAGGGDGCSGGSSSGGDCSVAARGARRVKLSIWLMLAAALALPLRRLGKRRSFVLGIFGRFALGLPKGRSGRTDRRGQRACVASPGFSLPWISPNARGRRSSTRSR